MISKVNEAIEFDGVSKSLGENVVLENLTFSVPKGAIVGLLGANGSGKSTCVRLLAGHIRPDRGQVRIDGSDLDGLGCVSDHVSILGDMIGLPAGVTVGAALVTMTELLGLSRPALADAIEALGLADRLRQGVGKLSKGWHQRVKLAVALASSAPALVLDEPTNGLDAASKQWLADSITRRRDEGGAILLVTHEYPELQRLADEMIVINRRTLYSGPTLEFEAYERLTKVA